MAASPPPGPGDDRRPLGARSLALSTLLGTDPPDLPVGALVAVGELFDIAPGTTRTALSRMASSGELVAADGRYRLVGRLLERRAAQEAGRHPVAGAWDGRWHWVVVRAEARSVADRRLFRSRMADHRLGELRPEVWLRPANLAPPDDPGPGALVSTGHLRTGHPAGLAQELWDLDGWSTRARELAAEVRAGVEDLAAGDDASLPPAFLLAAAVLRHLRRDPLLPPALLPPDWAGAELRQAYETFDQRFQGQLQAFLRRTRT